MKEFIFDTINNNHPDQSSFIIRKSAKEIESHFMEFMEWVGENCFKYDNDPDGWIIINTKGEDTNLGNTDKLYSYWLTNIKNK